MSSQPRTRIVMEIADSAADFESEHDRTHFIDSACGGDEELKQQVREYLEGGAALFAQTRPRNSILPENLEILSALIPERLDGIRPGSMLGPYRVEHLIGEGGMGQVYKARDTRLDRYVAIKVSKEEFGARFAREARVR